MKSLLVIITLLLPAFLFSQAKDSLEINKLDEAVVRASRMQLPQKDIPQKVDIIHQSLIEMVPNQNLGTVLKSLLNLDIIEYPGANTTISLRGFPVTGGGRGYTPILIDGLPAGTINLATIPMDFIERIEVVRGPYSVLYGSDAMGGIINIITKKCSSSATGNVGVAVGNFGQTQLKAYVSGAIQPKLLFAMGYSRFGQNKDYRIGSKNLLKLSETEKNILDQKSYGDIMTNTQYNINQFNGKLEYHLNAKWRASIYSAITSSNDIETPGNYWHSYGLEKKDINRFANYGQLEYNTEKNNFLFSPYISIHKDDTYSDNTDAAYIASKQEMKQYGVKIGNTRTWGNIKWLLGADFDNSSTGTEQFAGKGTPGTPYIPDNSRYALSGFTQLAYIQNNLSINAGIRYNYTTYSIKENELLKSEKKSEHYSNFNPSMGIKYRLSKNLSFHGSLGSAFFVPDPYKIAGSYVSYNVLYKGNKDLKPETTTSFDLGINYNCKDVFNFDLTYFRNFYKDRIIYDFQSDYTSFKNAQKGNMDGLELLASVNLARLWSSKSKLELYGEATYFLNNNLKDVNTANVSVTKNALYTRKATANFGIHYTNNTGFDARLNGRYIGHRLEADWMGALRPNIKAEDYYTKGGFLASDKILQHSAHLILDFSSFYSVNKSIRIGITIANLGDENYSEKDGYNMPGRSLLGHFNFSF